MITKKELENAARAMGYEIVPNDLTKEVFVMGHGSACKRWNPLSPTTQGKSDLMDLMLDLKLDIEWYHDKKTVRVGDYSGMFWCHVEVVNGNDNEALAEAAMFVASQIWESKNG